MTGDKRTLQDYNRPPLPAVLRVRMEPMFEVVVATAVVVSLGLAAYLFYLMSGETLKSDQRN
jgi:hypothetical protein